MHYFTLVGDLMIGFKGPESLLSSKKVKISVLRYLPSNEWILGPRGR